MTAPTESTTETPTPETGEQAEVTSEPAPSADIVAMERALKKANKEAADSRRKLQQREEADLTEAEKALGLARKEGEAAAQANLAPELTKARLELAVLRSAGTKLADPGDALRFLDPADVSNDDGVVDAKKLNAEIDALIRTKPYLAADYRPGPPAVAGGPRGTQPEAGAGSGSMNDLIRRAAGRT